MATDALSAHARDELGLGERGGANALLAASASAVSFSAGAALPTLVAFLVPLAASASAAPTVAAVSVAALAFLAALGALSAWLGGAPPLKPTLRVAFWGALAMAVTAAIGALIGKAV
jgi:VIT1/CCC1 family predicted Fe2+/Mn2+ transporter